jgi:hypothetical protein
MKNFMGRLYHAGRVKYIYDNKVNSYRGRPVLKVELIERRDGKVTFCTDWPVEEITIDEESFNKHFHRW